MSKQFRRTAPWIVLGTIALVVLVLSLLGCGSSTTTTTAPTASSATTAGSTDTSATAATTATTAALKQVSIAYNWATSSTNAMQEMALGAEAAAEGAPGVNFSQAAPGQPDVPKQVSLLQAAMNTSKDGIAIESLQPDLFARPVADAKAAGIPIVAVDAPIPGADLVISNSNFDLGVMVATEIIKSIPADAKGEVVMGVAVPGLSVLEQRVKGMESVLKKERPGLTMAGPYDTKMTPSEAYAAWSEIVKAHPKAVAYMWPGSADSGALADIQRQTGKKLLAAGCDLETKGLQAVKDGYIVALGSPEHWMKGYIATKLLIAHAQLGTPLPTGWWNTGSLLVTKANIDDIMARETDNKTRLAWFQKTVDEQLANPTKYLGPLSAFN
jgi:ABC-type sugar transport system substrate-binding protein